MNDFKAWLAEREEAGTLPTGQEVHIQGARRSKLRGRNCFQKSMDFTGRPSVTYMMRDPANPKQRHGNFTEILMDLLSDEARQHEYFGSGSQMTPVDTFDDESYYVEDRPSIPPVDVINIYYDRR
jgi:hypothetical protein